MTEAEVYQHIGNNAYVPSLMNRDANSHSPVL